MRLFYLSCAALLVAAGCSSKSKRTLAELRCPVNYEQDGQWVPHAAMLLSDNSSVILCGHREDIDGSSRVHISEFEILQLSQQPNEVKLLWQAGAVDERDVEFFPSKKEIEIILPVQDRKNSVSVLRDVIKCKGEKCDPETTQCAFKPKKQYMEAVENYKDLKKWMLEEDHIRRATDLFFAAASGDKRSRDVFLAHRRGKLSTDGAVSEALTSYDKLLDKVGEVCKVKWKK